MAVLATSTEQYGDNLIQIALDILLYKQVHPAVYAPIQLITPQNLDKFCPIILFSGKDTDFFSHQFHCCSSVFSGSICPELRPSDAFHALGEL